MTYLARVRVGAVAVLILTVAGCSDDGVAPARTTTGAGSGGTGPDQGATSSVNTSATVTASGDAGGDSDDGPGPFFDVPPAGSTSGQGSDGDSTGLGGASEGDGDSDGDGTGAPPLPDCVAAEECMCDPNQVYCDAPPPECPPDEVPVVDEGCWDGTCVPIDSCYSVEDCSWCDDDEACVAAYSLAGPQFTCQPIPRDCAEAVPTCECMPDACEEPFFECADVEPGSDHDLSCFCPTC